MKCKITSSTRLAQIYEPQIILDQVGGNPLGPPLTINSAASRLYVALTAS